MHYKKNTLLFLEFITVSLIILLETYISQLNFTGKMQFSYITLLNLLLKAVPSAMLLLFLRVVMIKWGARPFKIVAPVDKPLVGVLLTFGGMLTILIALGAVVSFFSYISGMLPDTESIKNITDVIDISKKDIVFVFPILLVGAYWEELLFRAYMISRLKNMGADNWVAIAVSSVMFGMGHLYEGGIQAFLLTSLLGAFLGRQYLKYKNIHITATAHFLYNLLVIAIVLMSK